MPRKPTIKSARKRARAAMSRYVRYRDSNREGYCRCCSCGKLLHWSDADAGHFRSKGSSSALEFDEENVHAQCKFCNNDSNRGMPGYTLFMIDRYGREFTTALLENRDTVRRRIPDYLEIERHYTAALEDLQLVRGESPVLGSGLPSVSG